MSKMIKLSKFDWVEDGGKLVLSNTAELSKSDWLRIGREQGYIRQASVGDAVVRDDDDGGMGVFSKHMLNIARKTVKMNDVFANIMGGMNKTQAHEFLFQHGTSAEKKAAKKWLDKWRVVNDSQPVSPHSGVEKEKEQRAGPYGARIYDPLTDTVLHVPDSDEL